MEFVLPMQGGHNFRDLGGYENVEGKKIRSNRLIRAAKLADLTQADLTYLQNYGVEKVIDFRTAEEITGAPDKKIADAKYLVLPVFKEDTTQSTITPTALYQKILAGESGAKRMQLSYEEFVLTDDAHKAYHDFFAEILTLDKGLIFHCTAGKDRTGFGAYLILSALKVPDAVIERDYLATNKYLAPELEKTLSYALTQGADDLFLENITALLVARSEYLATSIAAIAKNYGDVDHFLREAIGLSPSDLATLQHEFLI